MLKYLKMNCRISKFYLFFQSYYKIFLFFLLFVLVLKGIEGVLYSEYINANIVFEMILHYWSHISFLAIWILPMYILLRLASKKISVIVTGFAFATLVLMELSFTIYYYQTGTLVGAELILRPINETVAAVFSVVPIVYVLLILTVLFGVFILFSLYLEKKNIYTSIIILSIILQFTGIFLRENTKQTGYNPMIKNGNKYIINKSVYCLENCYDFLHKESFEFKRQNYNIEIDANLLSMFRNENPAWEVKDSLFTLERCFPEDKNVLGPYFRSTHTKPNVVVIIVESLGNEWSEESDDGVCLTPFLDSLSKISLYWKNCLSTTSRSYGALPAIIGSLPYGRKGFQFGNMPDHQSLISILKKNAYQTNVFYGGDLTFDCVSEFLIAQHTDFMAPFYVHYKKSKEKTHLGNWWGYFDHIMFDESMKVLQQQHKQPQFNLFITITNHEKLKLSNPSQQTFYIRQTEQIIARLPKEKRKEYEQHKARFAAMVYTDDCIRKFINAYAERPDFEQTIFVITGDHASGLNMKNVLAYHHVPLIIWSPLLIAPQTFKAVVSHNDIAPSLLTLLKNNYHIETPNYIHWLSDGLDTVSYFRIQTRMPFLNYTREIREMIYNNYYYNNTSKWENEAVYLIDSNLNMQRCYNDSLMLLLRNKLYIYKYIHLYTYHTNHLTTNPIFLEEKYIPISVFSNPNIIICTTPKQKPSEVDYKTFYLLKPQKFNNNYKLYRKIRINLYAEVYINDSVYQDQYMDLRFICKDKTNDYTIVYKDKIVKFLNEEHIYAHRWYDLSISKEFIIKEMKKLKYSVCVTTPANDNEWVPNTQISLRNIKIKIEGL